MQKKILWYRFPLNSASKKKLLGSQAGKTIYELRQKAIGRENLWQFHKVLFAIAAMICSFFVAHLFLSSGDSIIVSFVAGLAVMFFSTLTLVFYMKKDPAIQKYAEDFFNICNSLDISTIENSILKEMLN